MSLAVVDSHCHLDFPDFADELDVVVGRARDAGVGVMVTISTRVRQFDRVLAIAEAHDCVYCSIGTHPHNAGEETDVTADELVRLTDHPKVVAIGEAGLDYFYDHSPRADQERSFRTHIRAARETGLPLVIHTRDAEEDTARILREEMEQGSFKSILHCFSSGRELARAGLDLGLTVSFSGIVTFNKADALREVAAEVPLDRLLVETDAPYLAPVPRRGKRNEPAYVVHTLNRLAEIKGIAPADLARLTSDNFFALFSKVPRPEAFAS